VNWVYEENVSKDHIFHDKIVENKNQTTIVRLCNILLNINFTGGWLCLVIGIILFFSPVYLLLAWFPLIGGLLGYIGFFIALVIFIIMLIACRIDIRIYFIYFGCFDSLVEIQTKNWNTNVDYRIRIISLYNC